MFDFLKTFFGTSSCRGCKSRKLWGLYCGCKPKKNSRLPHGAWQRFGCWNFVGKPTGK